MQFIGYIIAALYAISLSGIVYIVMQAFESGADAYAQTYSDDTSRQFEDIFLFIPARRITEIAIACSGAVFLILFLSFTNWKSINSIMISAVVCALISCLALLFPKKILDILRVRRRNKINEQLVDTLSFCTTDTTWCKLLRGAEEYGRESAVSRYDSTCLSN